MGGSEPLREIAPARIRLESETERASARIEIVYVEPPLPVILAQNKQRTKPVPEKVILRLVEKLEPPTVTECHRLTFA